jgi:hypothetical protein
MLIPNASAGATGPNYPDVNNLLSTWDKTSSTAFQSTYNCRYNPYNGLLYSSDAAISTYFTNYIVPSGRPDTDTSPKHLIIRCVTSAPVKIFTIKFLRTGNIESIYVKWKGPTSAATSWYDASQLYTTATGCKSGDSDNSNWLIRINSSVDAAYSGDTGAGNGNIYFNIRFTGTIQMNQFGVTV